MGCESQQREGLVSLGLKKDLQQKAVVMAMAFSGFLYFL